MELLPTIDALALDRRRGPEILADEHVPHAAVFLKQKRSRFSYEPLGVVGVIAPWNYPWSIPFGEVAMALMAGNGVVLKPASLTPLIGERIREVFERAGLPEGLVRTVHGGGAVGKALVESSAAKIFFTGSVEVGRRVGVACAERLKGSVLELGGKDPMIVCADAQPAERDLGLPLGRLRQRRPDLLGHRARLRDARGGRPLHRGRGRGRARRCASATRWSWTTEIGPMVSRDQYELVRELVDDAVANGAELRCGGPVEVRGLPGAAFYAPDRADRRDPRHADHARGDLRPGGADRDRRLRGGGDRAGQRLAVRPGRIGVDARPRARASGSRAGIESGMVWINDHMYSHGACPCSWGGVKDSGIGRAHSKFGFYECVNVKLVAWEPSARANFWWHPYDESLGSGLHARPSCSTAATRTSRDALRRGPAAAPPARAQVAARPFRR